MSWQSKLVESIGDEGGHPFYSPEQEAPGGMGC